MPESICPNCGKLREPEDAAACACGHSYASSSPSPSSNSGLMTGCLIAVGIVLVILAIIYAGCAYSLRGL